MRLLVTPIAYNYNDQRIDYNKPLMPSNLVQTQDPRGQLFSAWLSATHNMGEAGGLPDFLLKVRAILDGSQITKEWRDDDKALPPYKDSPHELRGALKLIRPWRTAFFRLTLGGILANSFERGWEPLGREFWLVTFPNHWCDNTLGDTSPISPSLLLPAPPEKQPTALTSGYKRWAADVIPYLVAKLGAPRLESLITPQYDPTDPGTFSRYAHVISVASVILMADKLGLGEDVDEDDAEAIMLEWLDSTVSEPFQYRYRGDRQLWPPDKKRVYVDLTLRPILGQVLTYENNDWCERQVTRSLSLWEASTRTVGDTLVHTQLRRIDLELAVWCEAMLRLMPEQSVYVRASAGSARPTTEEDETWKALPRRVQVLARQIREATRTLAQGPTSSFRFLAPSSLQYKREALSSSPLSLAEGDSLIPYSFTSPRLSRDGKLRLNLGWDWVSPDADWMDIRLLVLTKAGKMETCSSIDFKELELEEKTNARLVLHLEGETWEMLSRTHGLETLIDAFSKAWFARRTSGLGTGVIVVGLVNLVDARC